MFLPNIAATNWFIGLLNNSSFKASGQLCIHVALQKLLIDCVPLYLGVAGDPCTVGLDITFEAIPNDPSYDVYWADDLNGPWTMVMPAPTVVSAINNRRTVHLDNTQAPCNPQGQRFYRVVHQ